MPNRVYKLLLVLIAFVFLQASPAQVYALDLNLDLETSDTSLDSCGQTSSGLSSYLGCDSDGVIDFTQFDGSFSGPDADGYDPALTRNSDLRGFILTVVNYALSFLGLFAVIMVIYGGVLYVLSRGDEEMAGKGKKTIGYSAIGLLIVLGSFAFVNTIIGAGGGGGASGGTLGSGVNTGTIAEAGADFDVNTVLREVESITGDYLSSYQELLAVKKEVSKLNGIELPYILSLNTSYTGVGNFFDNVSGILSTDDSWGQSTEAQIYDVSGLNDFLNSMLSGIQKIQTSTDNLSHTYYVATQIYSYLKTGTKLPDDLISYRSTLSTLSKVATFILPSAKASNVVSSLSDAYSPGTCASLEGSSPSDSSFSSGDRTGTLDWTNYSGTMTVLYEEICVLIGSLDLASETDFKNSVDSLSARIGSKDEGLIALFNTDLSGASSLSTIVTRLESAKSLIESSANTLNVDTVQRIISALDLAYSSIQSVEFVNVTMSASTLSGNAPLLVSFNVVGTEDPSGKTVSASDIEWDLDGDGRFNDGNGYSVSNVYNDEGSYRVRVRVKSTSTDIAAGIASTTVNVNARRSKIVLTGTAGGETTSIADFSADNKFQYVDKDSYRVTTTEAQAGIRFDASSSTDGTGQRLSYVRWDFGDGEISEGAWSGENISPTHAYSAGTYDISLTVTDSAGIEDRKYFTLYVGSPASRIKSNSSSGRVGDTFRFDGSGSSTDVGSIVSYNWSISSSDGAESLSNNSSATLDYSFSKPGIYTVQLQVADGSNNRDTSSVSVLIESTPPVVSFECSVKTANKPGTLTCDASKSYDPDEDDISYLWSISGGQSYEYLEGGEDSEIMIIRFTEIGSYEISLKVTDDNEEELKQSSSLSRTYNVSSVLELTMSLDGESARTLGTNGSVDVNISGETTGSSIELSCGNGTSDFSDSLGNSGRANLTCTYTQAGIYSAVMLAYDEQGRSTKDTKRVYIGSGNAPIAVLDFDGNGNDLSFDGDTLYGNVKTRFTFDASKSVNLDGSVNNLSYSWNFGNGKTSSSKTVTTTFDEVAKYTVTLTVRDRTNNTLTSESSVNIQISPIEPKINKVLIVPQGSTLETPLKVNVSVDATDEDGRIAYVKAWYYDFNDTAEPLGTIIAQSLNFSMTINTKGEQGAEMKYGFVVEVTDTDNLTVSSEDVFSQGEMPTITVVNGPNDNPEAHFSVDITSVYVGEEINFANQSFDPDGRILYSWWDIGADGTHNDERMDGTASLNYTFTEVHPDGIEVRLKVEDDSGATSMSDILRIYVDSNADAPDAKFLADVDGTKVSFQNNSFVDTDQNVSVKGVYWDFDLSNDSDGNGVPDDDFDSFEENPVWDYGKLGTFQVKMTIVDSVGQVDSVTQDVNVLDTKPPIADFTYSATDKQVKFVNTSSTDVAGGVDVRSYVWDFDLDYDADGDGNPANDVDSSSKNPSVVYDEFGFYDVSLTIVDTFGKSSTVEKTIEIKDPVQAVTAKLTTSPSMNSNKQVVLNGSSGDVSFFFGAEGGSGKYTFEFDKNIFFDTNGDGIKDNDIDYSASQAGTWKTPFYKSYGTIVVMLTVTDNESGEKDSSAVQVVFQDSSGSANLINVTPNKMGLLILSTLLATIGVISLVSFTTFRKK